MNLLAPVDSSVHPTSPFTPRPGPGSEAPKPPHLLGEWLATAIAGNDLLSSCLYTSGLCAAWAGMCYPLLSTILLANLPPFCLGVWSPICLSLIIVMLHFFRAVYSEVGCALPLNGGAYNALLNTTSKQTASIAACLTILRYGQPEIEMERWLLM